MNILLIEDNDLKREKIFDHLKQHTAFKIIEAASYNKGLSIALERKFDLIILDMSMPTFDRTDEDRGGRFRVFAGREIATRLKKINRLPPFVVLTGYREFRDDSGKLDFEQIGDLLSELKPSFKGIIHYDSSSSSWKDKLTKVLETLEHDQNSYN
ncbi:hypothetical protein C1896_17180 [Pseudomonadaceae bacterium SI-3]|jgi:CheY-like chemotaxis protein|nr:hypothetical protein C1896_17180 [Pseudomonadaceae bacterium SI-3]